MSLRTILLNRDLVSSIALQFQPCPAPVDGRLFPRPTCPRGSADLTLRLPALAPSAFRPFLDCDTPFLTRPLYLSGSVTPVPPLSEVSSHTAPSDELFLIPATEMTEHARTESVQSFSYAIVEHPTLFFRSIFFKVGNFSGKTGLCV